MTPLCVREVDGRTCTQADRQSRRQRTMRKIIVQRKRHAEMRGMCKIQYKMNRFRNVHHVEIGSRSDATVTTAVAATVAVPRPHASCSRWYGTVSGTSVGGLHLTAGLPSPSFPSSSPPHSSSHAGHTMTPLCSQPLATNRITSSWPGK